jgi:hypothetical protein
MAGFRKATVRRINHQRAGLAKALGNQFREEELRRRPKNGGILARYLISNSRV